MNWKRGLLLGLVSAALSVIACILYDKVYSKAFYVDFSKIIHPGGIIISCTIASLLMAISYILLSKWKGEKLLGWANIVFCIVSFATVPGVLAFKLPLDMEAPEMFPGLAIPMHFFPALAFLTVYPFFKTNK